MSHALRSYSATKSRNDTLSCPATVVHGEGSGRFGGSKVASSTSRHTDRSPSPKAAGGTTAPVSGCGRGECRRGVIACVCGGSFPPPAPHPLEGRGRRREWWVGCFSGACVFACGELAAPPSPPSNGRAPCGRERRSSALRAGEGGERKSGRREARLERPYSWA